MDNYELSEVIGRGGGGSVYLAKRRHSTDSKPVVVKKILLDQRKERTKENVICEARILEKLRHPNIVTFIESFFEKEGHDEYLYVVQDYCDGGSLADVIKKAKKDKQQLSESSIMKWFLQVTIGLQYIHSQKVLHRDLKASNIFLTKTGRVKIGDFGISRELTDTEEQVMTCIGTPMYLSPELCEDQPYNSKSDMWALGCLLYELCALRPPFTASTLLSLYYKIVKSDLEPLPTFYTNFLHRLTTELLDKDPQKRPAAGALLQWPGIQNLLQDLVEETEASQAARRIRRSIGRSTASLTPSQDSSLKLQALARGSPLSPSKSHSLMTGRQVELPLTLEKTGKGGKMKPGKAPALKTTEPIASPDESLSPLNSPQAVDYPDDFEEESDSDANLSPRQSITASMAAAQGEDSLRPQSRASEGVRSMSDDMRASVSPSSEYDEDFEEYETDSDEDLEDVLCTTRQALSQEVVEDDIVDDNTAVHLVKALKKCCLEAVGTEQLKEALDMLETTACQGRTKSNS